MAGCGRLSFDAIGDAGEFDVYDALAIKIPVRSIAHDIGATCAYHGQRVSLLWQSKQARTASSRVRGRSQSGSCTTVGFE